MEVSSTDHSTLSITEALTKDFAECLPRDERSEHDIGGSNNPQASHEQVAEASTHDQLSQHTSPFERLNHFLQSQPEIIATEVRQRVEEGANVEAILQQFCPDNHVFGQFHPLNNHPNLPYGNKTLLFQHSNNPYFHSKLFRTISRSFSTAEEQAPQETAHAGSDAAYRFPYGQGRMFDPRLHSDMLRVSRWTSVGLVERLLRTLIEVYFLYEYPWCPCFHKDILLDAMITGDHDYCSPLLVNALLSAACHGHPAIPNRAEFWNSRTIGHQFMLEARRLWDLEQGHMKHSLPTIQAAMVLGMVHFVNGMDRIGWNYWTHAVVMAQGVDLFSVPSESLDPKDCVLRTTTAWGVYSQQAMFSFYFVRPPLLSEPPKARLPNDGTASAYFGEIWIKYPSVQQPIPMLLGHTILALLDLRCIMNEIGWEVLAHGHPRSELLMDKANRFHLRLLRWLRGLPPPLQWHDIVLPSQLLLHMQYHNLVTMTFSPLMPLESAFNAPDGSSSLEDYIEFSPGDAVVHSMSCLETILLMFNQRHGLETYHPFLFHILTQFGFESCERSNVEKNEESIVNSEELRAARSTLLVCAKGLWDQGQNFYLAQCLFRILRARMRSEDKEAFQQWAGVTGEDETEPFPEHVHGALPINVKGITEDPSNMPFDRLIKAVMDLGIEERRMTRSPEDR